MPIDGSPRADDGSARAVDLVAMPPDLTPPDLSGPVDVPLPKRIVCTCGNGTNVADCASIRCDDAPSLAALCSADCNSFGGGTATKCLDTDVTCTPVFPGPSLVHCNCDNKVVAACAQVDCASGPQRDAVCRYLCFNFGHEVSADCTANAVACR